MKIYSWLSGTWTAVLWFFTLGIAIPLFRAFPGPRAAEVAVAVFPYYFGSAIILGILATITLWLCRPRKNKRSNIALVLQSLAILTLVAIPAVLQPAMEPHIPGSPEFMRLHGISSLLNLFSLLAAPAAFLLVAAKRKEESV